MISKKELSHLYIRQRKSMKEISQYLHCSIHQVQYWLSKYNVPRRTIKQAVYLKYHPNGDPFRFQKPKTVNSAILYGMGLGLYWGEGTKANLNAVRLGNTDPALIKTFIRFLTTSFHVKNRDLKFGLQIFSDIREQEALKYWIKHLQISKKQFYKPTLSPSQSTGTYRRKNRYGVLTIYYNNTKLREMLIDCLDPFKE